MVFDKVYVLGRGTEYKSNNGCKLDKASGKGVEFVLLPDSHGIKQLCNTNQILKRTKDAIKKVDAIILRVPSLTSSLVWKACKKSGKPVGVEVVVDPELYFAKGTTSSISERIAAKVWTKQLKNMCLSANGASYVTQYYLQNKYPCKAMLDGESKKYFTSHYSSVCLKDNDFIGPKEYYQKKEWTIIHVNNYITGYRKGHSVVLNVVKELKDKGINTRVRFIGDGDKVNEFKKLSEAFGENK